MKCALCGIEIEATEKAIEDGWIPSVWEEDKVGGRKYPPFIPTKIPFDYFLFYILSVY